jgi:tRNA dimethylallyltransferase
VTRSRPDLHARIAQRMENMFSRGLISEVAELLSAGVPASAHAFKAIGYRESLGVVRGEWDEARAREATAVATRRLARRQLTWLRGERSVEWLPEADDREAEREALARMEASLGT